MSGRENSQRALFVANGGLDNQVGVFDVFFFMLNRNLKVDWLTGGQIRNVRALNLINRILT